MEDADSHSKILFFIEQLWTFVAVSLGVAFCGVAVKRVVAVFVPQERLIAAAEEAARTGRSKTTEIAIDPSLPLWYRLWRASITFHPVLAAGLMGFTPLPVANWVPADFVSARVLWFALAGMVSGQVFEMGKDAGQIAIAFVRKWLGLSEPVARRSVPPPEPAPPAAAAKAADHAALADALEPEDKGALPKG